MPSIGSRAPRRSLRNKRVSRSLLPTSFREDMKARGLRHGSGPLITEEVPQASRQPGSCDSPRCIADHYDIAFSIRREAS
jgi:hypothetical protein